MSRQSGPCSQARFVVAAVLILFPLSADASVMHLVDSMDNLFFTDWGHPYNVLPYSDSNNEFGAIGRGAPAEVVSNLGSPTDFGAFAEVEIEATGSNAIHGTIAYGPDGLSSLFRGLPVYSLIGVWSSSSSAIVPVGGMSAFFIGSSATLDVPSSPSAFLWLGFNDGIYTDNLLPPLNGGPGFSVTLSPAPEPSTVMLLALALLGARARRRRA